MRIGIVLGSLLVAACATPGTVQGTASLMGGTSWQFTEPNVGLMTSSFDADGRFRAVHDGKVVEAGRWTVVRDKLCEDNDATADHSLVCFTLAPQMPAIGSAMTVTSDKGESLVVTRVAYVGP